MVPQVIFNLQRRNSRNVRDTRKLEIVVLTRPTYLLILAKYEIVMDGWTGPLCKISPTATRREHFHNPRFSLNLTVYTEYLECRNFISVWFMLEFVNDCTMLTLETRVIFRKKKIITKHIVIFDFNCIPKILFSVLYYAQRHRETRKSTETRNFSRLFKSYLISLSVIFLEISRYLSAHFSNFLLSSPEEVLSYFYYA